MLAATAPWRCTIDRIEAIVADDYITGLDQRDEAALRDMKSEAATVENAVSYYRRLAQGRLEILAAEQKRRAEGGTVADLVAQLPEILAGDQPRSGAAHTRLADPEVEIATLSWHDGRERLVTDDATLASLPVLGDADLVATIEDLQEFERELSDYRHRLHQVLDAIDAELARRAVS
jgi:hypothetical protein